MIARRIVAGTAEGPVIVAKEGLSFWGGVDPATGRVIDAHHPLAGVCLTGAVLMMPTSRGSCTGSGVLLDLAMTGRAPAALVFRTDEDVLTLGALIAGRMFDRTLPVLRLDASAYDALARAERATITATHLVADDLSLSLTDLPTALTLSDADRARLAGPPARRLAMEVICAMAAQQGATELVDVSQAHVDGCIYASPANLLFAEAMADMGAQVCIPTTMNAISVDRANWRAQGVPPSFGGPASRLADAYVRMGARPSFTCAPYLLDSTPKRGDRVAWAESNAVVYANSVIGARTVKHPDFLDLMIALTGRAPLSGVYRDADRVPRRIIGVEVPPGHDDALWPLIGYVAGLRAPDRIPILTDLPAADTDALKAMCAAFGTTSAAPMLHIDGLTPEAAMPDTADRATITRADLADAWRQFNAGPAEVDLIAIGSPHASLGECRTLAALVTGTRARVKVIVTCGHDILAAARAEGTLAVLEAFGAQVVPDLCWCSISEPVFPPDTRVLLTNSGKYAHYAPGLSGRAVRFGSLADCARAAVTGRAPGLPPWLKEPPCAA
ncbi:cis-3-hydroxy-L-proline dehydratase [Falsirhodobacter sp. 20TX0035]|uniref:cis-3-hydroxy-L-proline dehydratase n=1 Tax=Falsirhodobacter sp. 20TX0035 TaxID=3022019 RepID=UPI00232DFF41|nr:aconitase family protein [Falsirhodobacter sp. 20TX0035]MDB6452292.1 aconitase family protein [Falsirhodobacter sp. 20TX0035]